MRMHAGHLVRESCSRSLPRRGSFCMPELYLTEFVGKLG